MRNQIFFSFLSLLLLAACGQDIHEKNNEQYKIQMRRLGESVSINPSDINQLWVLSGLGHLYRDKNDSSYDAWIYEPKEAPDVFLFVKNNRFTRARLRRQCPALHGEPEATWLLPLGFNAVIPKNSLSKNPEAFLESVEKFPPAVATSRAFGIRGQTFETSHMPRDTAEESKKYHPEIRILALNKSSLELAYINPEAKEGVHASVEIFRTIGGEELFKIFSETHDLISKCGPVPPAGK
jgi:hypothetical protein